jgi:apolipoprotein N-acyltransferase
MIISFFIYKNYQIKGEPAEVIISQPNIDPWKEQYILPYDAVFARTFNPVEPLITPNTEFVVCPESAIQEDLWHHNIEGSRSILHIRKYIGKYPNINLIIGASTFRMFEENEPLTQTARKFNDVDKYYEAFNTALFLNRNPGVGMYHKSKLVPGPEKMPFQRLLRPLQDFAFDLGGTVGSLGLSAERTVFTSSDGKFTAPAIICYESVYGGFVAEFVKNGANLLFIITNDGWWEDSPGHKQHFSFAPLRAVETRRNLARSANTGISAFIDQRGDIIEKTEYWKPAVLKASLPANNELTFYVKYGDYIGRISTFVSLLLILVTVVSSVVNRKNKLKA